MVQSAHLVVVQVGVGLDGGQAGEFLLAVAIAGPEPGAVRPEAQEYGWNQLVVKESCPRPGVPFARNVRHAVVRLDAEGHDVGERRRVQVEGEAAVVAVIVLGDGAAENVRRGEPRVHHVGPFPVLFPVQRVGEGPPHEQFVAEGIIAQGGEGEAEVGISLLGQVEVARLPEDAEPGEAARRRLGKAHAGGIDGLGEGLEEGFQFHLLEVGRALGGERKGGCEEQARERHFPHCRPSLSYLRGVGSVHTTKSAELLLVSVR